MYDDNDDTEFVTQYELLKGDVIEGQKPDGTTFWYPAGSVAKLDGMYWHLTIPEQPDSLAIFGVTDTKVFFNPTVWKPLRRKIEVNYAETETE